MASLLKTNHQPVNRRKEQHNMNHQKLANQYMSQSSSGVSTGGAATVGAQGVTQNNNASNQSTSTKLFVTSPSGKTSPSGVFTKHKTSKDGIAAGTIEGTSSTVYNKKPNALVPSLNLTKLTPTGNYPGSTTNAQGRDFNSFTQAQR